MLREAMMLGGSMSQGMTRLSARRSAHRLHAALLTLSVALLLSSTSLLMTGDAAFAESGTLKTATEVSASQAQTTDETATQTQTQTQTQTTDDTTMQTQTPVQTTAQTGPVYTVGVIARATVVYTLDDDGGLSVDGDAAERACVNVTALCKAVTDDETLSISLSVSPVLLERWSADTQGAGAECIGSIEAARRTGRLELLSAGYADPDLPLVIALGHPEDVAGQYARAAQAYTGGFSSGTCPASCALVSDAVDGLVNSGVTWSAVDRSLLETQLPGASVYTSTEDHNLYLLAIDRTLGDDLLSTDQSATRALIETQRTLSPTGATACAVEIGALSDGCTTLIQNLKSLARDPGNGLDICGDIVGVADSGNALPPLASLRNGAASVDASFSEQFDRSHDDAGSLEDCLYSKSDVLTSAYGLLYGSESAGTSDTDRIKAAAHAQTVISDLMSGVHIEIRNMTLAGTSGTLPLQVFNDTDAAFEVTIRLEGDSVVAGSGYDTGVATVIYSGENYLQIPVTTTSPRSMVTVDVEGGGRTIASTQAQVKTSHINDITLIVCAVAVVIATVIIVYRRRRRSRSRDTIESDRS